MEFWSDYLICLWNRYIYKILNYPRFVKKKDIVTHKLRKYFVIERIEIYFQHVHIKAMKKESVKKKRENAKIFKRKKI